MWEDTKLVCYLRFILSSWIFQSALWKQDHRDSPGPFWWSCVSAAAVSMIPSSSLFHRLARFTVFSASDINIITFSTENSLGLASLFFLCQARGRQGLKKKGRCQQFYSSVCIMGNRHTGFKCGEEMRDSVKSKKGNLVTGCCASGDAIWLIVFTHFAFVVEYLDPWGLLCCKYLRMQAKWQYERSYCCEPCSVPYSYYAKCGLIAREMASEYIVYSSILCHVWFNTQSWSG